MATAKNAIFKAKIEGVINELMFKTNAANVYVDDSTTLAAKLSSIIADIATKASTKDLTNGLAGKANSSHIHAQSDVTGLADALAGKAAVSHAHAQSDVTGLTDALAGKAAVKHTHAQSDITGLTDALAKLASTQSVTDAIDALRQEMLGDTPVEAYNTFTELAAYIAEHKEVSDALSAAVGKKADKATTLAGYGIADAYTKTEVDKKISAATGGESAADVRAALDTYKSSNNTRVEALEGKAHTHANKTVLDVITSAKVTAWDAKTKVYYSTTEPAGLTENDLWVQLT